MATCCLGKRHSPVMFVHDGKRNDTCCLRFGGNYIMSLLRNPRNLILMVCKSLKIKVCFETLLEKKTFWRGLII